MVNFKFRTVQHQQTKSSQYINAVQNSMEVQREELQED